MPGSLADETQALTVAEFVQTLGADDLEGVAQAVEERRELLADQKAIGRHVAELRERRGLTQADMAHRVGVSPRAYQNWESGEKRPNSDNRRRLAKALGVTEDDILDTGAPGDVGDRLDAIERHLEEMAGMLRVCLRRFDEFEKRISGPDVIQSLRTEAAHLIELLEHQAAAGR